MTDFVLSVGTELKLLFNDGQGGWGEEAVLPGTCPFSLTDAHGDGDLDLYYYHSPPSAGLDL